MPYRRFSFSLTPDEIMRRPPVLPLWGKVGNIFDVERAIWGRWLVLTVFAVLLAGLSPAGTTADTPPLPPEAARVAEGFLYAFSRNDRDAIEAMVPRKLANLYGPSPFDRMPSLSNPRADGRVGALDFRGKMTDPGLPATGIIILRCVEEGGTRGWRVRQIYWYDDLPPEADIPDHSKTEADRRQEPDLRQAAKEFLHFWLAGDYQEMDRLTFHWWKVDRRRPKWVNMTGVRLKARPTALAGVRVDFVAKLKLVRIIPRSVGGNIWLVEEDGAWRVRPVTFAFFF